MTLMEPKPCPTPFNSADRRRTEVYLAVVALLAVGAVAGQAVAEVVRSNRFGVWEAGCVAIVLGAALYGLFGAYLLIDLTRPRQ